MRNVDSHGPLFPFNNKRNKHERANGKRCKVLPLEACCVDDFRVLPFAVKKKNGWVEIWSHFDVPSNRWFHSYYSFSIRSVEEILTVYCISHNCIYSNSLLWFIVTHTRFWGQVSCISGCLDNHHIPGLFLGPRHRFRASTSFGPLQQIRSTRILL